MSTKIYDGLRVPISDIGKFIKIFDNRCLDYIEDMTLRLMDVVKWGALVKSAELAKGIRGNQSAEKVLKDEIAVKYFRYLEVAKLYIDAMKKQLNFGNPDCWFNAFPYGKYFYIIPGYPTGLKYVKYPKYVEEFNYWNNTDPPSDTTWMEFNKRGNLWEKSGALETPFRNRLTHNLIEYDKFSCSLILVERRIITERKFKNGISIHPASYIAPLRLEQEERDEYNRNKNSKD
ncbi:hypothetical protein LCGC14_2044230 [marine sediment metagenome]|uniref:Uncharacterized protein n=1 Tax=marine sediment metagenome TaxID=412755 RepID=A0A0F9EQU1_9ZZZZ